MNKYKKMMALLLSITAISACSFGGNASTKTEHRFEEPTKFLENNCTKATGINKIQRGQMTLETMVLNCKNYGLVIVSKRVFANQHKSEFVAYGPGLMGSDSSYPLQNPHFDGHALNRYPRFK